MKQRFHLLSIICLGSICGLNAFAQDIPPRDSLKPAIAKLEAFIRDEMKAQDLPAVSIALVEGNEIVWAKGFGMAKRGVPASADTIYRVGSVSKLFTDIAVMQLVEKGELDLDAPVSKYLPDFTPKNPFEKPITLRQMMAHRSGLVRESPVGHYFDPTSPSLADTIKSLNATELVFMPETRTKYSNAAIATVGMVVEKLRGEPFATSVKRTVTDPLGMTSTAFELSPAMKDALADGQMWTYDGRTFKAPMFALGTSPAGNMYASVVDLGRFLAAIMTDPKVVKPETLRSMFVPQFSQSKQGFGLGFDVSQLDGQLRVRHGGAVYGFATEFSALPDVGIGAAVVVTKDCANTTATRINEFATRLLLAVKKNEPLPVIEPSTPLPPGLARLLEGRYGTGDAAVDLTAQAGRLYLTPLKGGFRVELRKRDEELVVDDPLGFGAKVIAGEGKITLDGRVLDRQEDRKPEPPPASWLGLIGEYGWDHDTLYILEWNGQLYALIEWFFFDKLEQVSPDVFKFPNSKGLYLGESLYFTRDLAGKATKVEAAKVVFERRKIDGDDGSTFRITPVRPVAELRPEAMMASPPIEKGDFIKPNLVDLTTLDSTIKLDIRYATDNNFASTPFYSSARAFMQKPASAALLKAHQNLKMQGYGLLIHDAYRPWYVTKMFWEATPPSGRSFVANPAKGSKHNRGCAVDLTLYDLNTGKPIEMVGGYDEFSTRSSPDYPGGTSRQRWYRDLLRRTMEAEGFAVNEVEWWHFDYKDWPQYPILNESFEQLSAPR